MLLHKAFSSALALSKFLFVQAATFSVGARVNMLTSHGIVARGDGIVIGQARNGATLVEWSQGGTEEVSTALLCEIHA